MSRAIMALAPEVADAIAAGEVVERPASVVKELVENSLDAGARRVSVEVRGAGRSLIRVADDGAGIPAGQLRLAFLRHATSKVRTLDDLLAIGSLGFRGEALASVAAVADTTCQSSGERLRVRFGEVAEEGGAAPAPGTAIEVRDLFANTPARLKFLKSDATEQAAALRAVSAYALLYPEVRFQVLLEGRTALSTPGDGDHRRAIAAVHGAAVAAEMLEAVWEVPEAEIAVSGLVSQPRLSRGTRDAILLAVGRRPIASRALGYALEECYRGRLERGRYPVAVIDVTVAAGAVDVNVHPAKREVRFREEGAVFAALQQAVRASLGSSQPYRLQATTLREAAAAPSGRQLTLHEPAAVFGPATMPPVADSATGMLRPVGQVMDGYLVAEGADGLVLIDQHAAHERVLYNRFIERLRGQQGPSQALLMPQTVDLDPGLVAAALDHRGRLEALGFQLDEFGPRALQVRAAPVETPPARVAEALQDLLATLAGARPDDRVEKAAASIACHSAVRFGDAMDLAEQRRLLAELEAAADAMTCPHGRPTRLVMDWQSLKLQFRRNY